MKAKARKNFPVRLSRTENGFCLEMSQRAAVFLLVLVFGFLLCSAFGFATTLLDPWIGGLQLPFAIPVSAPSTPTATPTMAPPTPLPTATATATPTPTLTPTATPTPTMTPTPTPTPFVFLTEDDVLAFIFGEGECVRRHYMNSMDLESVSRFREEIQKSLVPTPAPGWKSDGVATLFSYVSGGKTEWCAVVGVRFLSPQGEEDWLFFYEKKEGPVQIPWGGKEPLVSMSDDPPDDLFPPDMLGGE